MKTPILELTPHGQHSKTLQTNEMVEIEVNVTGFTESEPRVEAPDEFELDDLWLYQNPNVIINLVKHDLINVESLEQRRSIEPSMCP